MKFCRIIRKALEDNENVYSIRGTGTSTESGPRCLCWLDMSLKEGLQARDGDELQPLGRLEYGLVAESAQKREIHRLIQCVSDGDSTVLIHGESGTGEELVARAIHNNGSRCNRPFVAVNCAAVTESLSEIELFGYEKGAFTGAFCSYERSSRARAGRHLLYGRNR